MERVIDQQARQDYGGLRDAFRWTRHLQASANMGVVCSDAQPPGATALIQIASDGDVREYTFGDLAQRSDRMASALAGLGLTPGDRVGIVLPQGLDAATAHLGTYKFGGVAVPMTQLFGPDALRFRLADSGARVVITDGSTLDRVAEVAAELGDVHVLIAGEGPVAAPHQRLTDVLVAARPGSTAALTGPDDPALLIYTSGTTGNPKGALHGHRVLLGHLPGFELMFDLFPHAEDRMWTPADWAWIGGLLDAVLPSWFHGRPVVAAPRARFDPEWAVALMADHHVRTAFLPPTALKLLRTSGVDTAGLQLRSVMSGGEPLGAEMLAWGREELGVTINEIYGQTEANLLVGNSATVFEPRPGSMGRAYPGHDVAILTDGVIAPPGTEGEIVVRSPDPVMMLEYWGQPEATERKFAEVDGTAWLRTGDIGRVDDDGFFWFTARADDVIISASYRIGPGEIEECILTHPDVAMVAVIGVPDEIRGQVVKAFVQLVPGREPTDELRGQLQHQVRERLAAYEYPRILEFVDQLPLTTTGKIRRTELRSPQRPPDGPAGGGDQNPKERGC